jgi:hypothetical protein
MMAVTCNGWIERINAKLAFGLSPKDPVFETDDFKQALGNLENSRKAKSESSN